MYKVIDNYVYTVTTVETETQTVTIEEYYDNLYHINLSVDKTTIKADGVDTATIIATIYDYQNNLQDVSIPVVFEFEGNQHTVTSVNGKASITFNAAIAGTYKIRTVVENYRNDEIEVVVQ